jgi:putative ABC transport system permease protein
MHLYRLVFREILFRKVSFLQGVLSAAVAVACLVGEVAILRCLDADTERILVAKEAQTRARMASLEDDYRKIMKGLGFNVLILPREQNLGDLFAEDYASHSMPEEYVERLANSRLATIQHLLPSLQRKLKWPEVERTIILVGVRGEVPVLNADAKKPILEPVPAGTMVLGWELHRSLKVKIGDQVKLLGREFTIRKLHPERGNKDDITVWINLQEAQQLLNEPGRINGILALECVCAAESLTKVRAEIGRVLPETQVIEFQSQMLARAEARQRAAAEAQAAIEREKQTRARLHQTRAQFAAVAVPLVALGSAVWIFFLSFGNVRERRVEIGVLRALGCRSRQIIAIFLARALLMGAVGAVLGSGLGILMAAGWREGAAAIIGRSLVVEPRLLAMVFVGAPVVAGLAGWLPALTAAQQDPAIALNAD